MFVGSAGAFFTKYTLSASSTCPSIDLKSIDDFAILYKLIDNADLLSV
jgi:hypothetical protein